MTQKTGALRLWRWWHLRVTRTVSSEEWLNRNFGEPRDFTHATASQRKVELQSIVVMQHIWKREASKARSFGLDALASIDFTPPGFYGYYDYRTASKAPVHAPWCSITTSLTSAFIHRTDGAPAACTCDLVLGSFLAWGKVALHDTGARAIEWAQPEMLVLGMSKEHELEREAAEAYGLETVRRGSQDRVLIEEGRQYVPFTQDMIRKSDEDIAKEMQEL